MLYSEMRVENYQLFLKEILLYNFWAGNVVWCDLFGRVEKWDERIRRRENKKKFSIVILYSFG